MVSSSINLICYCKLNGIIFQITTYLSSTQTSYTDKGPKVLKLNTLYNFFFRFCHYIVHFQPNTGKYLAFDHVKFWVGNAKQVVSVFTHTV